MLHHASHRCLPSQTAMQTNKATSQTRTAPPPHLHRGAPPVRHPPPAGAVGSGAVHRLEHGHPHLAPLVEGDGREASLQSRDCHGGSAASWEGWGVGLDRHVPPSISDRWPQAPRYSCCELVTVWLSSRNYSSAGGVEGGPRAGCDLCSTLPGRQALFRRSAESNEHFTSRKARRAKKTKAACAPPPIPSTLPGQLLSPAAQRAGVGCDVYCTPAAAATQPLAAAA